MRTSKNACPTLSFICVMPNELKITRRHLPHWTIDGVTYFVTFRSLTELTPKERTITFDHIISGHKKFYVLSAFIVMPDHIHVLLQPIGEFDLGRIMKGIKGVSANKINEIRSDKGQVWQHESYDHIIRNGMELKQKFEYILNNSVDAGLVESSGNYEWLYWNEEIIL